ncbi:MAG: hypothetical protein KDC87_03660 [Planctomycetes bacterium]|nr:hypothetical protein [Planctomycetota bacterium]MCB9870788.1 hypothetical protein [Planctomycetota bacterium]
MVDWHRLHAWGVDYAVVDRLEGVPGAVRVLHGSGLRYSVRHASPPPQPSRLLVALRAAVAQ